MTRHLVETGIVVGVVVVVAAALDAILLRRAPDAYSRRSIRRTVAFAGSLVVLLALAFVWRVFAGRAALVVGLVGAGFAFALQEMIGAVAGWFNILLGGIYRVGDRVELSGVRGDVIDITPLRTKLLELGVTDPPPVGQPAATDLWVRGRQPTGRIVTVSNKTTFTSPVFNYSGMLEYVWQGVMVPVAHAADWRAAETILRQEAERVAATEGAQAALDQMRRRYRLPHADVEPRVFMRANDNYVELSMRFPVPTRNSRAAVDALTRRVHDRLAEAGIEYASATSEVTVRLAQADSDAGAR